MISLFLRYSPARFISLALLLHCSAGLSAQWSVEISGTSITCHGAADGAATAIVDPPGVYLYTWSNGLTTSAIEGLEAGIYTVTVTHSTGETAVASIQISEPPQLGVSVFGTPQICAAAPDGSVIGLPYGGTPPYTYLWSNDSATAVVTGLVAGAYSLETTDAHGCIVNSTAIVPDNSFEGIWSVIDEMNATCAGGNQDGAIHVGPMSGTPPYTFLWNTGQSTQDISGIGPGGYSVTITDANGCVGVNATEITLLADFTITAGISAETCSGTADGSMVITLSDGTPPYQVEWSNGDDSTAITGLSSGLYSVTITNSTGCVQTEEFWVPLLWPSPCDSTYAIPDSCLSCPFFMPDGFAGTVPVAVTCALIDDLADPAQGLCAVRLHFEHDYVGDLSVSLYSPAGQNVQLMGPTVFGGPTDFTEWNVVFVRCDAVAQPDSGFSAIWSNNQPWGIASNYSGSYLPYEACLEDLNSGAVNGIWQLEIIDNQAIDVGTLFEVELIFCDGTAVDSCGPFVPPLAVDFVTQVLANQIYCINLSQNASGYLWQFNNDTISNEADPVFTSPGAGTFPISLTAWNDADTLSVTKSVTIVASGTKADETLPIRVSPNPFGDVLRVEWAQTTGVDLRLSDARGQLMRQAKVDANFYRFDTRDLPAGVYFLQIGTARALTVRKLIKD